MAVTTTARQAAKPAEPPRGPTSPRPRCELDPVTLRFTDPEVEAANSADFARRHLASVRVATLLGVFLWPVWGVIVRRYLRDEQGLDSLIRYGVMLPLSLAGLGFTFTRWYTRFWEAAMSVLLLATAIGWVMVTAAIDAMPVEWGYIGLILIMTVMYTLVRLRFVLQVPLSLVMVASYLIVALVSGEPKGVQLVLAVSYLISFWLLGMVASYILERSGRLLFLRERQLERERARSDALLLNTLPKAIVDRLKVRDEEATTSRLAEGLDEVTVLFADAVGFTAEAAKTTPDELVEALDELFTKFDALADKHGLEKIKTVGDEYMAAAGVPQPRSDHASAAADMALAIVEAVKGCTWPSGDPMEVRIGMASGPVVAGVIGQRKFAYDLWGDTVNLASRLESHGQPGRILVSEGVVKRLDGRYQFAPSELVDLKGKGPTPACFLIRRVTS
jgi:class 3 adenylate cyclase